jgi:sensor domain CHASE-containing protein
MRYTLFGISVVLGLVMSGDPSAQSSNLRSIMKEKLLNTQQLLEGVVKADFTIVDKSTDRLARISYTEVASWQSNADAEYLKHASAFVNAVQGLRKGSVDRNSGVVAHEYTNLLNSCVSCHSYLRRVRAIRLEGTR